MLQRGHAPLNALIHRNLPYLEHDFYEETGAERYLSTAHGVPLLLALPSGSPKNCT